MSSFSKQYDVLVFGGAMVEQVVRVPSLPGAKQANVPLLGMETLPGGSGANVAVYVARMGGQSAIFDKWGEDEIGDDLKAGLEAEGVHLTIQRVAGVPSPFMIILTLPGGDWSGIVRLPGELALTGGDIPAELVAASKYLHFHGFCMNTPEAQTGVRDAIQSARAAGTLISMDASTPLAKSQPEVLRELFAQCDIVFANQIEAEAITEAADAGHAASALFDLTKNTAVVKLGDQGVLAASAEGLLHVPAFPVQVVDTIGAGDALVAGTLLGLCQGETLSSALQRGSAAAALVCQGAGAQSNRFHGAEVEALRKDLA